MRRIWTRADIEEGKDYVLVLYQTAGGKRSYAISKSSDLEPRARDTDFAFSTEVVPMDLVLKRDVLGISEQVKLQGGESFFLDSNGVWLTREEFEDMAARRHTVRWYRGVAPT